MFSFYSNIIFMLNVPTVSTLNTNSSCPVCPINCTIYCDQIVLPDTLSTLISILLLISEVLPFIKNIRANGVVDAIHKFIFHKPDTRSTEPTNTLLNKSSVNYNSI
jgi:hypothetical protein